MENGGAKEIWQVNRLPFVFYWPLSIIVHIFCLFGITAAPFDTTWSGWRELETAKSFAISNESHPRH